MEINHYYISAEAYSKQTGLGVEEVKRLCRIGRMPCERTKKGYYKIKVYKDNCVSREEYDIILKENSKLKQLLKTINNISNYKED